MSDLKNRAKDGRDSTMNAMKELIDFGYAIFKEEREKGMIKEYDYVVSDDKSLLTEKPLTEKPVTDSPKLPNTNKPNTNHTKKDSFPSGKLYKSAIDVYYKWYENKFNFKPKIDGIQGKSMKFLLKNLSQMLGSKDEKYILNSLHFVFDNWHLLDNFNQKQVELKNINSNLNNIVTQIARSKDKQVFTDQDVKFFLNL
jgi:hypothetical protein